MHQFFVFNENALIIGEDILDPYGGAFKVTSGLYNEFPSKVYSSPISEAAITGIGIGAALRGGKVIVEIMFGDFITLSFDQIINHASKFKEMYGMSLDLPLVIRTPMGGYRGYGPTHSQSLEKHLLGIPYVKVVAMNHFYDPGRLLEKALGDDTAVIFCENKSLYSEKVGCKSPLIDIQATDDQYPYVLLNNNCSVAETDVSIISYGGMSKLIESTMLELADDEIWIDAVIVSELSNVERTCELITSLKSKILFFIEEGTKDFNWSDGIISRLVQDRKSNNREIFSLSSKPSIIPTSANGEADVLPTLNQIKEEVFRLL